MSMTLEQQKQFHKATALNAIRKMYDPRNNDKGMRSNSWVESYAEQRDHNIRQIIEKLEKELQDLKTKSKMGE